MAKRFTDTDKWKKKWFRTLEPLHKCFWQYLCDTCNHAGIWDVDFELAEFIIGSPINVEEIKKIFKNQYKELKQGKKWFVIDFISFQYGELNPQNRAHSSVIAILKKEGAYKGLTRGLQARKDMDMDMDMDKDKDKEVLIFWNYYLLKVKKKFKLTSDKKALIKKKLGEGYTLEQLKQAVDRFAQDDWEGRQDRLDLIYCIGKQQGKPDNLEKWLNKPKSMKEMEKEIGI